MPRRRITLLLTASLSLLPLSAAAQNTTLDIVTDLPVVARMVSAVGGDSVSVRALLAGGDPHATALRPSEAAALAEADLIVWTGPDLNPSLSRAIERLSDAAVLTLSEVEGTNIRAAGEEADIHDDHDDHEDEAHDDHGHADDDAHAEHDEHAHEEHDDHDHAAHDHGDTDPHTWLDPANAMLWTDTLATVLTERGIEGAQMRADAVNEATRGVVEATRAAFAQTAPRYGVDHDALGYFSDAFDTAPVAIFADSSSSQPGPRRVAAATEALMAANAACLVVEADHESALPARITEIAEVPLVEVDLTGSRMGEEDGYPEFLSALSDALLTNCVPGA